MKEKDNVTTDKLFRLASIELFGTALLFGRCFNDFRLLFPFSSNSLKSISTFLITFLVRVQYPVLKFLLASR